MRVSVVVCTLNRPKSLKRLLTSFRYAVIPDHLSCEFIVVDNNSDDATRVAFDELQKQYELRLRCVFEPKMGISHARNKGIKEARGEIIAFTDDDVIVDKYWIQNVGEAFREHTDVACIGGKILPSWEISKPKWLKPSLYGYLALLDHGDSAGYVDASRIWGANFAVKSEMFTKYGLFDSNLGRIQGKLYSHEEVEFLQRLLNGSERILYYPSSIVYHCVSADRISKRYFRKHSFDAGELNGIFMNDVKYTSLFKYHSAISKKMLKHIIASVLRIGCLSKNSFAYELRICYILGFLSGRIKGIGSKS